MRRVILRKRAAIEDLKVRPAPLEVFGCDLDHPVHESRG